MKILIKRFDKGLPMPEYKTTGAAAFDLACREDVTIKAGEMGYLPLNVAIKFSSNYVGVLVVRSSTHKLGLMPGNGIGIIDSDFCGDEDEYKLIVYNYTKKAVKVERGTRVGQLVIMRKEKMEFVEVDKMKTKNRGGFGSTGKK